MKLLSIKQPNSIKYGLIGVIILTAILHLFQPTFFPSVFPRAVMVPPSLNWDETSLGYNAYSILKTGKDEWGRALPISFEAFGDYKLPVYIYTDVPFVALFGLNEFSVRLPSVLAGIMTVFGLFLLVKELTQNDKWALLASLIFCITPWHIFISRMALEANLSLCLMVFGSYFFLLSLKKPHLFILPSIFFSLTLFTYNSARVFTPLFLLGLVIIYRKTLWSLRKYLYIPAVVAFIFFVVAFYQALFVDSGSRYFWVTILDQGAINDINQARGASTFPPVISKLIFNRVNYFVFHFIKNYFSHFSLDFLFLKGGSNHQFSVPDTGILLLVDLPFLLFGLWKILKIKTVRSVVLLWLLIAPVPSAITREAPHVLRAIYMLGALQIISSFGILNFLNILVKQPIQFKKILLGIIGIIFSLNLLFYLQRYFFVYPYKNSQAWQYGMQQAYYDLADMEQNPLYQNRQVFVTKQYGEPHIFYIFFNQYDPAKYQNNLTLIRYSRSNWRWVDHLDNITFVNDWEMKSKALTCQNNILITTPGNFPSDCQIIDSIYFLDGTKAFDIVTSE